MPDIDHQRILVKAARLYYEQDLNQAQIADRLRLSRQKVQRILREARDRRVVQITISPLSGLCLDLEKALEERFGLAEAIVVETTDHRNQNVVARELGAGAAEYLLRVVRPNDKIVMSWGNSLLGMVDALPYSRRANAEGLAVIQGLGGLGDPSQEIHATQIVARAAKALGAQAILLPAPAIVSRKAARDAYCADPYVDKALKMARSADLAFVGIGSARADSVMVPEFWNILTPSALSGLVRKGAIGSVNLRYFNARGKRISSKSDESIIGLTIDELRKIYRVVGVAGGATKVDALRGALAGKLINVLVTDNMTAKQLLS
jgi:DNA-binding transcriptional regulator LsrR (DeoR family)